MSVNKSLIITDLINGQNYDIRLKAVYPDLSEELSNVVSATPNPQHDAPEIVSITAGDHSLSVAFLPPPTISGLTVQNYQFSLDSGDTWVSRYPASTVSPLNITALTNGQTYYVKIRAVTNINTGLTQSTAMPGTPLSTPIPTTPSQPTINSVAMLPATSGQLASAVVTFTPPLSFGNSPITNYAYSLNGSAYVSITPTGTTFQIDQLSHNATYNILLRACNSVGCGTESTASIFQASSTPAAPTITSATATSSGLSTEYTVYSPDMTVTNIQYSINGEALKTRTPASAQSPLIIPAADLLAVSSPISDSYAPATHRIALLAISNNFKSTVSSSFDVYYLPRPAAPILQGYSATRRNITQGTDELIELTVNYTVSESSLRYALYTSGSSAATVKLLFKIECSDGSAGGWKDVGNISSTTGSLNITEYYSESAPLIPINVVAGKSYNVSLKLDNSTTQAGRQLGGVGDISAPIICSTYVPSGAPTVQVLDPTDGIRVLITAPAFTSGLKISYYEYTIDGGITWTGLGSSSEYFVIPIVNEIGETHTYKLRCRAVTTAGAGESSSEHIIQNIGLPPPIDIIIAAPRYTNNTFEGIYAEFSDYIEPSTAQKYQYSLNGGAWSNITLFPTSGAAIIPVTTLGIHQLRLRCVNSYGAGPASDSMTIVLKSLNNPAALVPTIDSQPINGAADFTNGFVYTLSGSESSGTATYQWYRNGIRIPNATSSSYDATSPGLYSFGVTLASNPGHPVRSNEAVVTQSDVSITIEPSYVAPVDFLNGATVSLSVTLSIVPPLNITATYQWYLDNLQITNATSSSYDATSPGLYSVEVTFSTNPGNPVPSNNTVTLLQSS